MSEAWLRELHREIKALTVFRLKCSRSDCKGGYILGPRARRGVLAGEAKEWVERHEAGDLMTLPAKTRKRLLEKYPVEELADIVNVPPHRIIEGEERLAVVCGLSCEGREKRHYVESPQEALEWSRRHVVGQRHQQCEYEAGWLDEVTKALGLPDAR